MPVISFAKRTFKLPLLSEITPILFAVESLLSSVMPPLTVTFSPKLRWNAPLSPSKSKPAFLRPSIPFFKSPMFAPFVKLLLLSAILLIFSPAAKPLAILTTLLPPLFKPSLVNVTAPVPSLGEP